MTSGWLTGLAAVWLLTTVDSRSVVSGLGVHSESAARVLGGQ